MEEKVDGKTNVENYENELADIGESDLNPYDSGNNLVKTCVQSPAQIENIDGEGKIKVKFKW